MKKPLALLAFLLCCTGAFAQSGPGNYGGGYPGAKYGGQSDLLADLVFNGTAANLTVLHHLSGAEGEFIGGSMTQIARLALNASRN